MAKPVIANVSDECIDYSTVDTNKEFIVVLNDKFVFEIEGVLVINLVTGTLILFTTNYNSNNSTFSLKSKLLNIVTRLLHRDVYNFQLKIIDLFTIFDQAINRNTVNIQFRNRSVVAFIQQSDLSIPINLISELRYSSLDSDLIKSEFAEFVNSLKIAQELYNTHNYVLLDQIQLLRDVYPRYINLNLIDIQLLKIITTITENLDEKTKNFYNMCLSLHEYEWKNSKLGDKPFIVNGIKIQAKNINRGRETTIQLTYENVLNYIHQNHYYSNSLAITVKCLVALHAYENVMSKLNTLLIKSI